MTTELRLESYCQGCEGIEPDVVRVSNIVEDISIVAIRCANARKCARMYEQIKKEVEHNV